MTPSKDPRYLKAKRVMNKAHDVIDGAKRFLANTAREDEIDSDTAWLLLDKMGKLVNAEYAAVTKAVGVGVYIPYGRPSPRRW